MRRFAAAMAVVLMATSTTLAQEPDARDDSPTAAPAMNVTPTVEMWFYEQAKREHDDPKAAVRRNAEYVSAQRRARMAARDWYGISKSRPPATMVPMFNEYSPRWVSNTPMVPNAWTGAIHGPVVARPWVGPMMGYW